MTSWVNLLVGAISCFWFFYPFTHRIGGDRWGYRTRILTVTGDPILEVEEMLLMLTNTYPITSALDFAKFAMDELKNNPYPDFNKRSYYWKWGGDGLIMYVIYDIEEGNEEAALKDINSRIAKATQSVKGLVGSIEPLMNIEEVFSWISMTAPKV